MLALKSLPGPASLPSPVVTEPVAFQFSVLTLLTAVIGRPQAGSKVPEPHSYPVDSWDSPQMSLSPTVPHSTPKMHRGRKHHRTFSWPPLILRGSLPHPQQPAKLPDIDEDPFAHFITVAEDDDPLAMSAGILPSEQPSSRANADTLGASLARRWARYVAGNHGYLHDIYHRPKSEPIEEKAAASQIEDVAAAKTNTDMPIPSIVIIAAHEPSLGHAQEVVARAREAQKRSGRRGGRIHMYHRHSWQEPSMTLFTVDEEDEELYNRDPANNVLERRSNMMERARL